MANEAAVAHPISRVAARRSARPVAPWVGLLLLIAAALIAVALHAAEDTRAAPAEPEVAEQGD